MEKQQFYHHVYYPKSIKNVEVILKFQIIQKAQRLTVFLLPWCKIQSIMCKQGAINKKN